MKKILILPILVLLLAGCVSTGPRKVGSSAKRKADHLLKEIETTSETGDVEALVVDFEGLVADNNLDLSDFKSSGGEKVTAEWLEKIKNNGYLIELQKNAELFFENLKEKDMEDLSEYTDKIREMAGKLQKNLAETSIIIADYLKEKAVEFSGSDLMKALKEIWSKEVDPGTET